MALRQLNVMLERERTSYVLDADIASFFNHLNHDWIIKFIESKIKDPNVIRLVRRMLKAGIMEDYVYTETEEGSGQGSLCGDKRYAELIPLIPYNNYLDTILSRHNLLALMRNTALSS